MIVTDKHLTPLHAGFEIIVHTPKEVLERMNPWCVPPSPFSPSSTHFLLQGALSSMERSVPPLLVFLDASLTR